MSQDQALPPLPESDAQALQTNKYHNFYKVGSKDYWGDAEIASRELEDFKKCMHYFTRQGNEIRCQSCQAGWEAPEELQAIDGQLFFRGEIQQHQL